ncbi:hypothetical protein Tco_0301429, partial [Tanacetum coccineum]
VALSSALKATIALLIIVVVVTVVVVVVFVVTVVVVVVIVVVVSRPYPTVPGQMANPIAVTAPSIGLACVLPPILLLLVLIVLGKIIILSFPFCLTFSIGMGLILHQLSCKLAITSCMVFDFDAFTLPSIISGNPPIYFSI